VAVVDRVILWPSWTVWYCGRCGPCDTVVVVDHVILWSLLCSSSRDTMMQLLLKDNVLQLTAAVCCQVCIISHRCTYCFNSRFPRKSALVDCFAGFASQFVVHLCILSRQAKTYHICSLHMVGWCPFSLSLSGMSAVYNVSSGMINPTTLHFSYFFNMLLNTVLYYYFNMLLAH